MSKVALVTGGNRGIGRGITEALLAQGWRVSIMATRPAPADVLAELSTLGEVRYTQGRVADLGDHARYVEETLAQWGRIDALINNAGVAPTERNDLLEATPESYDRVMEVNLRGPYFLTQRVAKAMIDQGAPADGGLTGTIVNVSSISADTISTNRGEYCLSKAGVGMATQLWAVRLAPEGIVVYEVRPGVIATDMTAGVTQKYDAVFASGAVPMPRWGQPSDVGGAVVALTAGLMPYSTGDVITVGGGMQIKTL